VPPEPADPEVASDTAETSDEDRAVDRPVSIVSAEFDSSLDIDSAVAALSAIAADRGHAEDDRSDETDEDGSRMVTLDHEPRADGPLLFEGLDYTVTTTDGAEIRLRPSDSRSAEVVLRVLGPEPEMIEDEVFDAIIETVAPLWLPEESTAPTLRRLSSGPRSVFVSVSPTSRQTIVRLTIS
jgi:hypothetical protein